MLIVSKFHDYYDTASVYGIDKTCVYDRKEGIVDGKFELARQSYWSKRWFGQDRLTNKRKAEYLVDYFLVGFCGNLYPVVSFSKNYYEGLVQRTDKFHLYDIDSIRVFFKIERLDFNESKYRWGYNGITVEELKYFFNVDNYAVMKEYFHKYRIPAFVYGYKTGHNKEKLTLNPKLKDLGFGHIKGASTAFQDIFMFLSGVIGAPPKDTVELSDKEMAAKRGHNGKYSFRKTPGGKRGKPKWR